MTAIQRKHATRVQDAQDNLRRRLKVGQIIYTDLKRSTAAGMRYVKVLIVEDGRIEDITSLTSRAIGRRWTNDGSIRTNSPQDVVLELSLVLHGHELPATSEFEHQKAGFTFVHHVV